MNTIGIRHEDKYLLERRTPIVPGDLAMLHTKHQIPFVIEPSNKRIFTEEEFIQAGARISADLSQCDIIMGVKEMPEDYFRPNTCYIFFSHVIKAQSYNMPMLQNILRSGATLIDYEKVADSTGRRLIFFGRYAGLAGMINTLWAMGQRYQTQGIENPFSEIRQSYTYSSLSEAEQAILEAGEKIERDGLPDELSGLVLAVTGDGNVSNGALEIAKLLPVQEITARELSALPSSRRKKDGLYLTNITAEDYMHHKKGNAFSLSHYITHPEEYENHFETLLPFIHVLVNGIYWDERYPRLVTKQWLKNNFGTKACSLQTIGDITCDPLGSIECTVKATPIEDPVFVYDPNSGTHRMGFEGNGVCVMAVDILPSELPREASEHFSSALSPFMKSLAKADFSLPLEQLSLPEEISKAIIAHKGKLAPDYTYLKEFLTTR